ncbi:MAG TPA: hypothetical protein DEA96_05655, partial [Leptospiraceae bacterium]|nr:hypothetical protein [Leptospiraceae bacterium]
MTDRFCDPYDPAFLGSGHHRIIEASAGTGKTHFIEEQVLFWILHGAHLQGSEKHKVPEIHEVLVLTFTEKATGELKIRIRQRLARFVKEGIESLTVRLPAGADELEMRKRANRALKRFDSACIFTIHGFCNHIIRTTGLAGDADFKIEQNDLLRQEALAETVRKYLLSWFEHRLPLALSISGFFDYRRGYSSESFAFDQQLLNLLEHIREEGLPLDFSDGNVSNLSSGVEILSESKTEPKQELEKGPETESDAVPESETKPEPELDREPEAQDLFQYYEQNSTNPGATSTEASETTEPAIRARIQDLNQRIMDLDQSLLFAASRLKEKMDAHWLQGPPGKEGVLYQDIFAAR